MRLSPITLLLLGAAAGAAAETAPPGTPPPHHHHRHASRHARHAAAPAPAPTPLAGAGPAAEPDAPAPVPNEAITPPPGGGSPHTTVDPSLMSIHYPPVGEGYVQGSSPQAMDDRNTAKAPGLQMTVPIQPDRPAALPPVSDPQAPP